MLLIRRLEEAVLRLWHAGAFTGHYHLSIGQEATAAGVIGALGPADAIFSNHRNHAHVLARGADPGRALAEILGRAEGLLAGHGGTFHLAAPALGMPHSSALIGTSAALAAGAAHGMRTLGRAGVAVGFFGDGAMAEGIVHEALVIARDWRLATIFVCENNGRHAGVMPQPATDLAAMPRALGIASETVDGADALAVHAAAARARAQCAAGHGPVFILAETVLWPGNRDHWPMPATGTTELALARDGAVLPASETAWYRDDDPVLRLARAMQEAGAADWAGLDAIDRRVADRIAAAVAFAQSSPTPDAAQAFAG